MTLRTDQEMTVLLANIADQLGPLDKWTDQALELFNGWLADIGDSVTHEWVKRDANIESDC